MRSGIKYILTTENAEDTESPKKAILCSLCLLLFKIQCSPKTDNSEQEAAEEAENTELSIPASSVSSASSVVG